MSSFNNLIKDNLILNGMRRFVIRKDKHYCMWWWAKVFFPRFGYDTWDGKFKLSRECWWHPKRNDDDLDINKIIGVGFGINHHKDSWRIGFVPRFDSLNVFDVHGYFYDRESKEHKSEYIGMIHSDIEYSFECIRRKDDYYLTINGIGFCVFKNESKDSKLQFTLYPYMGGDNTAIREMYIFAKLNYR